MSLIYESWGKKGLIFFHMNELSKQYRFGALSTVSLYNFSPINRPEVVSRCDFRVHFPNDDELEHLFHVLVCYLYIFFG